MITSDVLKPAKSVNKYRTRYKCCNDTKIGCQLLCCKKFHEFLEDDVLDFEDKTAEQHFIWESTVDTTIKSINDNWSWACASLLSLACKASIAIDGGLGDVASYWIYFIIIFIAAVLIAVIEHSFESPEKIAKELEITTPKKAAAMGDKKAIKQQKELIEKAKETKVKPGKLGEIERILKLVEVEVYIIDIL